MKSPSKFSSKLDGLASRCRGRLLSRPSLLLNYLFRQMSTLTQISGFDAAASRHPRRKTYGVRVGHVQVGGGAPIVVQSMTNTDTADVQSTLKQTLELAEAGSEIVRWTVNVPEAAAAVPEIKKRLLEAGCNVPIIGDFHY